MLNEVFPPDSLARLKQVAFQIQIKEAGLGNVLVHGVMADQMEFSSSQWDNVNRKADELQREKQEKMLAIAQEYDALLLKNLTPVQRRKYDAMIGEPFSFVAVTSTQKSFDRVRKYRESRM